MSFLSLGFSFFFLFLHLLPPHGLSRLSKARPSAAAAAASGHHAVQKVRGDWESGAGELWATVWKAGGDRGRD